LKPTAVCVAGLAVSLAAAGAASADQGPYLTEAFGVARARPPLANVVGTTLYVRVSLGMRLGNFAVEPWVSSGMQTDRRGAWQGLVGGDPSPGLSDLELIGLDAKYILAVHEHVDLYVRGGPMAIEGNGALDGYRGQGLGLAGGVQVKGQVRALGFLWAPLFFVKRGPMATGALFLDAGYDTGVLHNAADGTKPPITRSSIDVGFAHLSLGFAVGAAF